MDGFRKKSSTPRNFLYRSGSIACHGTRSEAALGINGILGGCDGSPPGC
jgi:hypothetical protein